MKKPKEEAQHPSDNNFVLNEFLFQHVFDYDLVHAAEFKSKPC
jgi:hypothetical protein